MEQISLCGDGDAKQPFYQMSMPSRYSIHNILLKLFLK